MIPKRFRDVQRVALALIVDQGVAGCEVLGLSKHAVLGAQEVVGRVVVEIAAETAYGVAIIFGRLWNEFVLNYFWIEEILKEMADCLITLIMTRSPSRARDTSNLSDVRPMNLSPIL